MELDDIDNQNFENVKLWNINNRKWLHKDCLIRYWLSGHLYNLNLDNCSN